VTDDEFYECSNCSATTQIPKNVEVREFPLCLECDAKFEENEVLP